MSSQQEDLINPEEAVTLDGLFAVRVRRDPDRPAYRYFEKATRIWQQLTWAEMAAQVARWRAALSRENLERGERVALQLRNRPEWVMFDQAALGLDLVTVPLYTDDRPENIAYILEQSGTRLLLVQDAGRWRRLAEVLPADGHLKTVLLLEDGSQARELQRRDRRVRVVGDWLPAPGDELPTPRSQADPHALASIVYTSGTTGPPKGVMLSHHNMLSVAHGGLKMLNVYREDIFLSFLPLSHTLERTGGYYLPIMAGSQVAYARSVAQLAEDLKGIRPTLLIAVPRIFEKVYARIHDQMTQKGGLAQTLFDAAVATGWQRFLYQQGRASWSPRLLLWPLLQRLVARKVLAALGGRLRAAVSGGAALNEEVARLFIGLGLPIVQGYGLTETAPVISANPLQDNVPASVGLPLPGVQLKIGADEELLVRGAGVMQGYWNDRRSTAQTIDPDGWLHTGDQARIDASGHLYITGRLKDILVLSNGEKVPPGDMEQALALDLLFEQVMVVGEGRPYLCALIVLNGERWPAFAREQGLDPEDPGALREARLHKAVLSRIKQALQHFPGYARIRRVHLTLDPWGIENGLMTPTLKLKRRDVLTRHAQEIEAIYRDGPAA